MVSELVSTFRSAYPLFRFLCFRLFVCVVFIPYVRICCVESVFVIFVLGLCSFRARSVFLSVKKKKKEKRTEQKKKKEKKNKEKRIRGVQFLFSGNQF